MKLLFASLAFALGLSAEEAVTQLPVETAPFEVTTQLEGILIPSETQTLSLDPKQWTQFKIESVPEHGATIKAGEPLIKFESEDYEKAVAQTKLALDTLSLELAIAERELVEMQQRNEITLTERKQSLENAEADLAYFMETGLPARKEAAEFNVVRAQDYLKYQKEEQDQLLKMYEEDDLTEETEEIILVRQKAKVRDAQRSLDIQKRETARTLETTLPRSVISTERKVENARIAYATAKLNLQRQYDLKKIEVEKLKIRKAEMTEKLAEMEEDQSLLTNVASFDGRLFYGEFDGGLWQKGKTEEFLKVGKTVPVRSTILTLVKDASPLSLQALLDGKKAKELTESLANREEGGREVTVADFPNLAGKFLVTLAAQPPEDFQVAGMSDKQTVVFYRKESAIALPKAAIKKAGDGSHYVLVKLTEGEPEQRTVELGRSNGEKTEILSGLEEGQVVLLSQS